MRQFFQPFEIKLQGRLLHPSSLGEKEEHKVNEGTRSDEMQT